jgi:hypothetical protein
MEQQAAVSRGHMAVGVIAGGTGAAKPVQIGILVQEPAEKFPA